MQQEENMDVNKQVREIKQSFRLLMNGVTAQSMREKGVDYHINWGASLMHLREMASEQKKDKALAVALWRENIRECKILATMLMPHDEMDKEQAMIWMKDTHTQEIAEIATMNLYQHLPFAPELAITLIEADDDMMQIQGYNILAKHFSKENANIDENLSNAYLKNITMALQSSNIAVKHSAWNSIVKFSNINQECNRKAKTALKSIKMDDWL